MQPPAPIPPLPQAKRDNPAVSIFELLKNEEEKEVKKKKKGKMEIVYARSIKRTQHGGDERMKEAEGSRGQEEEAGPSRGQSREGAPGRTQGGEHGPRALGET